MGLEPTAEEVETQLNKVCEYLKDNPRQVEFLRYVVHEALEGRAPQIKETAIGLDVFGLPPDWDPKKNAIVRTTATNVRAGVSRYYASQFGLFESVGITVGDERGKGYVPRFEYRLGNSTYDGVEPEAAALLRRVKASLTRRTRITDETAFGIVRFAAGTYPRERRTSGVKALCEVVAGPHDEFRRFLRALEFVKEAGGASSCWEATFADACFTAGMLRKFKDGLRLFEKALEMSRGESLFFKWHTNVLVAAGDIGVAINLLRGVIAGVREAPISVRLDLAELYCLQGRFGDAWAAITPCVKPELWPGEKNQVLLATAVVADGSDRPDLVQKWFDMLDRNDEYSSAMNVGLAALLKGRLGDQEGARRDLVTLTDMKRSYSSAMSVPALQLGLAAIGAGKTEEAIDWLEKAVGVEFDVTALVLPWWPPVRHLRGHPRFDKLLVTVSRPLGSKDD